MVQSIELLFDEETDAAVRAEWAAIAAAGLPSLASHTGATNAPHVTVAVTEEAFAEPQAVARVFAGWGLAADGLAAEVGSPLLFGGPDRWVLVRQVVSTRRLVTLHEAVHRAIGPAAVTLEQTRPDHWTPHATLARRMPRDRIGDALAAIDPAPRPCRFVAARLWDSVAKTVTPL